MYRSLDELVDVSVICNQACSTVWLGDEEGGCAPVRGFQDRNDDSLLNEFVDDVLSGLFQVKRRRGNRFSAQPNWLNRILSDFMGPCRTPTEGLTKKFSSIRPKMAELWARRQAYIKMTECPQ